MTNGLEKLTYGTPEPKIKEAFRKVFYEGARKTQEPTGLLGQPYETAELKQKPLYGITEPTKELETTESREYVAGQISDIALESQKQRNAMIKEYKDYFLTQTELGQNKKWVEKIPTMHLNQLQDLHTKYQEYEAQKHQKIITQFGEQLGLDATITGQIQQAYPEEELPARLRVAGHLMTLIKHKPSADLFRQFNELVFPKAEEEPSMYEQLGEQLRYKELTTGEEGKLPTELPFELTSELDSTIRAFGAEIQKGMQEEMTPPEDLGVEGANELLNEVMIAYYGNSKDEAKREEAKEMINYTLRNMGLGTINWEMLE